MSVMYYRFSHFFCMTYSICSNVFQCTEKFQIVCWRNSISVYSAPTLLVISMRGTQIGLRTYFLEELIVKIFISFINILKSIFFLKVGVFLLIRLLEAKKSTIKSQLLAHWLIGLKIEQKNGILVVLTVKILMTLVNG